METKKIIWIIVGLAVFVLAVNILSFFLYGRFNMNGYYGHPYYTNTYNMNGFPYKIAYIVMPVMAVISILILVLFIKFIMKMVRTERNNTGYDRSEAILKERYARGEISEEQYKAMLNNLRNH